MSALFCCQVTVRVYLLGGEGEANPHPIQSILQDAPS